jgi:hypothetical protein
MSDEFFYRGREYNGALDAIRAAAERHERGEPEPAPALYIASSWSNPEHAGVVDALAAARFGELYNYRLHGFEFASVGYSGEGSVAEATSALRHQEAIAAHTQDMSALRACDAIVVLKRAGFSAGFELGFTVAQRKPAFILMTGDGYRADLVDLECAQICADVSELIARLHTQFPWVRR